MDRRNDVVFQNRSNKSFKNKIFIKEIIKLKHSQDIITYKAGFVTHLHAMSYKRELAINYYSQVFVSSTCIMHSPLKLKSVGQFVCQI